MFPVKLGPELRDVPQEVATTTLGATLGGARARRWAAGPLAAIALLGVSCGYRPVYADSERHFEVVPGRSGTASFEAMQEALGGVRSELSAAGALGVGYPQLVVEILRVDERSLGVRLSAGTPLARGSEVVVTGRARVLTSAQATSSFDTGDMSRAAAFAAATSASADADQRSRAVRDAARNLGRALGRAVLGLPEPSEG